MNKELIKQLAEGKCAVKNDGTFEELRQVLTEAFPNDKTICDCNVFIYENNGINQWIGKLLTLSPSYSVKEFLKEETMEKKIKVGTTFYHKSEKDLIYTISKIDGNNVEVSWNRLSTTYPLDSVLYNIKDGTWIITTEEKTMEKKIIGYKLIKPEYKNAINNILKMPQFEIDILTVDGHKTCISDLKEAGVLDLWFDKVYEEEYKVGDYVTVIESKFGFNGEEGKTYKIFGWQENHENRFFYEEDGQPTININIVKVRKATPEEIEKASTIKIGDYEVKFTAEGVVIENVTYTSGEIATLADLVKRGQIKTLRVGCMGQYTVDLELLIKILKRFK